MKINTNFNGFDYSSLGMNIQRKKMDMVAKNLANIDSTKTGEGVPYKRKILKIAATGNDVAKAIEPQQFIPLKATSDNHIRGTAKSAGISTGSNYDISGMEVDDPTMGDMVYMPEHPDANENGYVLMPNVNVVTEMVDMIAATRGYEANLTAFNASKQIAKDTLDM
jgi:flagellar basal-body rod protein FlgC